LNFCGVCFLFLFPVSGIADVGLIRIAKRSIDAFKFTCPYKKGSWIEAIKFGGSNGFANILNGASCLTAYFGRGSSGMSFFFLVIVVLPPSKDGFLRVAALSYVLNRGGIPFTDTSLSLLFRRSSTPFISSW